MRALEFTVLGVPAPKGSSRAMMAGGKAVNVPFGSKVNELAQLSWDNAVRNAAVNAVHRSCAASYCDAHGDGGIDPVPAVFFGDVPLCIKVVFRMRRPKGHFKKDGTLKANAPKYHKTKPDKDKLIRCTQDSLKGTVVLDDSLFSEGYARKIYAAPGSEGAWIRIEQLEEP